MGSVISMNINDLITLISSVGFPIVAAGALFWYMSKTQKENTEAIQNNTLVMQKLIDKLSED